MLERRTRTLSVPSPDSRLTMAVIWGRWSGVASQTGRWEKPGAASQHREHRTGYRIGRYGSCGIVQVLLGAL